MIILRRILAPLMALALMVAHADAQSTTRSALQALNNQKISANGIGAITGPVLNGLLNSIISSIGALADSNVWTGANTFNNPPIFAGQTGYCYANGSSPMTCAATIPLNSLASIGANTALGSIAGGTPIALSQAQLTALINPATAALSGAMPAWPNNTTTVLLGNGTYGQVGTGAGGLSGATLNAIPFGGGAGALPSFVSACASGIMIYSAGSVPACSTTLPGSLTIPSPASATLTNGIVYLNNLTLASSGAASSNLTTINNAIQSLSSTGGTIVLPCGQVYVGGTILNNVQNVLVRGCSPASGFAFSGSSPSPQYATAIYETVSGVVLEHITPHSSTTPTFVGGGFTDMTVFGNGFGTDLLLVDGVRRGTYHLFLAQSAGTEAAKFTSGVSGTDCSGHCDIQQADVDLQIDQRGQTGDGVVMTGSSNANFSFNNVKLEMAMNTGVGLQCVSADNNIIDYHAPITNGGQDIIAYGITASHPVGCAANTFRRVSGYTTAAQAIYAQGTDTGGVTAGVLNIIYNLDVSNLTPIPTAGTGSAWDYYNNNAPQWNITNLAIGFQLKFGTGGELIVGSFLIANLPSCGSSAGMVAYVTNGIASPTYLAAVSATGTSKRKVFCDGSSWLYD